MRFLVGESFEVGGLEIECLEEFPKIDILPLNFRFGEIGLVLKECDTELYTFL